MVIELEEMLAKLDRKIMINECDDSVLYNNFRNFEQSFNLLREVTLKQQREIDRLKLCIEKLNHGLQTVCVEMKAR